jgi:hypothetical protein
MINAANTIISTTLKNSTIRTHGSGTKKPLYAQENTLLLRKLVLFQVSAKAETLHIYKTVSGYPSYNGTVVYYSTWLEEWPNPAYGF